MPRAPARYRPRDGMTRILIAAVLAAALMFILGVILGRSDVRVPARWVEPEDGLEPDPYLASLTWTAS